MSTNTAPAHAQDAARAVMDARRPRPMLKATRAFVTALNDVPDSAVAEWGPQSLAALRTAAEAVIDTLERQIYDSGDSAFQRTLATAVYDIRSALEGMDRWERHYFGRDGSLP